MPVEYQRGLLDTNIMILRGSVDPGELPPEMAISAITLADLSAGPHQVRRNGEQDAAPAAPDAPGTYDEHAERARRLDVLQRAENEFDPIPFDVEAARIYGRVCAAVVGVGRTPHAASPMVREGLTEAGAAVILGCVMGALP